jgi:hypothetical protein
VLNQAPRHEDVCCLIRNYDIKIYCEVEVKLHAVLTSVLGGGDWQASRPSHFTPGVKATDTPWIGGWVGPTAGLDAVAKRESRCSAGDRTPVVQPAAHSLSWLSYQVHNCLLKRKTHITYRNQLFGAGQLAGASVQNEEPWTSIDEWVESHM